MFKPGDRPYLRLNHGYHLPGKPSKKTSPQRCGPFLVKKGIGRLAYLLELPLHWRVHPIISVAQLEPRPSADPYGRPRPDYPDSVGTEGDTPQWKSYEVERIVDKRIRTYGSKKVAQYLHQWKGYGPGWNEWRSITKVGNCINLMEDYEGKNTITGAGYHRRGRANEAEQGFRFTIRAMEAERGPGSTVLKNPMVVIPLRASPPSPLP